VAMIVVMVEAAMAVEVMVVVDMEVCMRHYQSLHTFLLHLIQFKILYSCFYADAAVDALCFCVVCPVIFALQEC